MSAKKKAKSELDVVEEIEPEVFGEDATWHTLINPKSYYPTRLEYFAGKIIQGLVTGRPDKDFTKGYLLAERAVKLALELEALIDSTEG